MSEETIEIKEEAPSSETDGIKGAPKKAKEGIQPIPEEIDLLVVNMEKVLYEKKVKSVIAPGPFGNFAVLPGHTPLFTKLEAGKLVADEGENTEEIDLDGGIAKITQFKMTVLCGFDKEEEKV